jgi:hypothetical protein
LFVSPNFYNYTCQALDFVSDKNYVSGVSLYKHELNDRYDNFHPIDEGFDNWYFQYAASWGQAWSKSHWKGFRAWYDQNQNIDNKTEVPQFVRSWSEKSWLKYYIAFLVEKNLFFMYPKISLTTNFSEAGTHVLNDSTAFQIPLIISKEKNYNFVELNNSIAVYDAFYENLKLSKFLNLDSNSLTSDLYGYKELYDKEFLITNKILNYKIVSSFGRKLKPIESNIIFKIPGNDIFLYDLKKEEKNSNSVSKINKIYYNIKYISLNDTRMIYFRLLKAKYIRVLKRIFNVVINRFK